MKVIVDGDSCRVIYKTERITEERNVPCHIVCDTSHILDPEYAQLHYVERRKDSADFAIINMCDKNDIVITNDSGLAAMVLAKKAYAINATGFEYTTRNIDAYLNRRYVRSYISTKRNTNRVKCLIQTIPTKTRRYAYSQVLKYVLEKSKERSKEASYQI